MKRGENTRVREHCAFPSAGTLARPRPSSSSREFHHTLPEEIGYSPQPSLFSWCTRMAPLVISRRAEQVVRDSPQPAGDTMAKAPLSKSDLIQILVDKSANEITRKAVKGVLEAMVDVGHAELKKNGIFIVPGLVRMVVVKKPATKERKGINPFTKEPTVFKAKPARKVVKARPVKAAKDAVA
jgi:DNA-binding protein HU-beta